MKRTRLKLIGLLSIVAILVSLLAVGQLIAGPSSAPSSAASGTVDINDGFFERADGEKFYSDETGFNILTFTVDDGDLSPARTAIVRILGFQGTGGNAASGTPLIVTGDAIAPTSDAGDPYTIVLEGETEKIETFSGNARALYFPYTVSVSTVTAGQTASALDNAPLDRDGDGGVNTGDIDVRVAGNKLALATADGADNARFAALTRVTTITIVTGGRTTGNLGQGIRDTNGSGAVTGDDLSLTVNGNAAPVRSATAAGAVTFDATAVNDVLVFTYNHRSIVRERVVALAGQTTYTLGNLPRDNDGDGAVTSGDVVFRVNGVVTALTADPTAGGAVTFTARTAGQVLDFTYNATVGAAGDALEVIYTSSGLEERPRDADGDGAYEAASVDDVQVTAGGIALTAAGYSTLFDPGIVRILGAAPVAIADNVKITYEFSEYDFANPANTPIASVGSDDAVSNNRVSFATDTTAAFDSGTSTKGVDAIDSPPGQLTVTTPFITPPSAVDVDVLVKFKYNVTETVEEIATVSSQTSGIRNESRTVTGVESGGAATNKFAASVALFSASDMDTMNTAAAGVGVTTIDQLANSADIDGTGLEARIRAAATALALAVGSGDDEFLDLAVSVADGDTLTVTYGDEETASAGTATITDTAVVDLTPPTIIHIRPSVTHSNLSTVTFEVEIEDAPGVPGAPTAGLDKAIGGDAGILTILAPGAAVVAHNLQPVLKASNPDKIALTLSQEIQNQGEVKFWAPVRDQVGNAPEFAGDDAVAGAGDPTLATTEPDNPFTFTFDNVSPLLTSTPVPAKTGGKLDDRLETPPSGTHTGGTSATVLNDPDADFVTADVRIGDNVTNITDGSSGNVTVVNSATSVTVGALTLGTDNDFDNGDAYTIENPGLGNVIDDQTNRKGVRILFDLGSGGAPLDVVSPTGSDFTLRQGTAVLTIVEATIGANGAGVLLTLAEDLPTDAKPTLTIPSATIKDKATNAVAIVTGTDAKDASDGLQSEMTVEVTGEAASRPVSREQVVITVTASETVTFPSANNTARYLKTADNGTSLVEAVNAGTANLIFNAVLAQTNQYEAIIEVDDITTIRSRQRGLVNVQLTAQDTSGVRATSGVADPDGTAVADAGSIVDDALVFEFDNVLNNEAAPAFELSPTITGELDQTDVSNPSISIDFAGESNEYEIAAGLRRLGIDVDDHATVTITKATVTDGDGNDTDVLTNVKASDDDTWVFAATDLAIGDYTLAVEASDAVGNTDLTPGGDSVDSHTFDFSIVERAQYALELRPGFNLVSLPSDPTSTDINDVLGAAEGIVHVLTYDPDAPVPWLQATRSGTDPFNEGIDSGSIGVLETIDAQHAYWMRASSFVTLSVDIPAQALVGQFPPTIDVLEGWNLVPIIDLTLPAFLSPVPADQYFSGIMWSAALTWNPANNRWDKEIPEAAPADNVLVGRGYWVWANEAGTIVP